MISATKYIRDYRIFFYKWKAEREIKFFFVVVVAVVVVPRIYNLEQHGLFDRTS